MLGYRVRAPPRLEALVEVGGDAPVAQEVQHALPEVADRPVEVPHLPARSRGEGPGRPPRPRQSTVNEDPAAATCAL